MCFPSKKFFFQAVCFFFQCLPSRSRLADLSPNQRSSCVTLVTPRCGGWVIEPPWLGHAQPPQLGMTQPPQLGMTQPQWLSYPATVLGVPSHHGWAHQATIAGLPKYHNWAWPNRGDWALIQPLQWLGSPTTSNSGGWITKQNLAAVARLPSHHGWAMPNRWGWLTLPL
jgi:hypothetical protein